MHVVTSNYFNSFIKTLFIRCGISVIIISYDGKSPALIYKNKKILNCHLMEDYLIFNDNYKNGKLVFKIRIEPNFVLTDEIRDKIDAWLSTSNHQYCYRVKIKTFPLYLCDYKITRDEDTNEIDGKHPMFAQDFHKFYFSKKNAREILKLYSNQEIELEIV